MSIKRENPVFKVREVLQKNMRTGVTVSDVVDATLLDRRVVKTQLDMFDFLGFAEKRRVGKRFLYVWIDRETLRYDEDE